MADDLFSQINLSLTTRISVDYNFHCPLLNQRHALQIFRPHSFFPRVTMKTKCVGRLSTEPTSHPLLPDTMDRRTWDDEPLNNRRICLNVTLKILCLNWDFRIDIRLLKFASKSRTLVPRPLPSPQSPPPPHTWVGRGRVDKANGHYQHSMPFI